MAREFKIGDRVKLNMMNVIDTVDKEQSNIAYGIVVGRPYPEGEDYVVELYTGRYIHWKDELMEKADPFDIDYIMPGDVLEADRMSHNPKDKYHKVISVSPGYSSDTRVVQFSVSYSGDDDKADDKKVHERAWTVWELKNGANPLKPVKNKIVSPRGVEKKREEVEASPETIEKGDMFAIREKGMLYEAVSDAYRHEDGNVFILAIYTESGFVQTLRTSQDSTIYRKK